MIRSLTRVALVAAIAILSLGLSASSAKAQTESVSFTLVNGTTSTMTHFYSSPTTDTHWGEDILDRDVLYPGEAATITIDDGEVMMAKIPVNTISKRCLLTGQLRPAAVQFVMVAL